jgi:hypothetical protein
MPSHFIDSNEVSYALEKPVGRENLCWLRLVKEKRG